MKNRRNIAITGALAATILDSMKETRYLNFDTCPESFPMYPIPEFNYKPSSLCEGKRTVKPRNKNRSRMAKKSRRRNRH